jgi:hypothetical protein
MRTIALIRVPGNGQTNVQVAPGTTWAQFISANGLQDRVLYGQGMSVADTSVAIPDFVTQVLATVAVKGA